MSKLVYLAGPIDGCSYGECTNWRERTIEELKKYGIIGISPMRGKEFLRNYPVIRDEISNNVLATDDAITARDQWDVRRSDAILFNLEGAQKISIGTMIEYGWANAFNKPIVTVMEPGNIHNHPIVRGLSGFRTKTLEEGIEVVKALFAY